MVGALVEGEVTVDVAVGVGDGVIVRVGVADGLGVLVGVGLG